MIKYCFFIISLSFETQNYMLYSTLHTDQRSKRIYQIGQYWITQLISGDDSVEMINIYPWKQQVLRLEIVFDFWLELHALCPASPAPDSPTETMQQCNNADWWLPGNHRINIDWHSGIFITQQASSHVYFQSDFYFSKYLFFSISLLNESLSELIHPSDWDKNISNWLKKYRGLFSLLLHSWLTCTAQVKVWIIQTEEVSNQRLKLFSL